MGRCISTFTKKQNIPSRAQPHAWIPLNLGDESDVLVTSTNQLQHLRPIPTLHFFLLFNGVMRRLWSMYR